MSDPGEPSEYRLLVERSQPGIYDWAMQGRHKGGSESDFATLAAGRFEPKLGPYGDGAFAIDFDAIRALNPTENSRGKIAYVFGRNQDGVLVAAEAELTDASGATEHAKYAFGQATQGEGFITFVMPANIDGHPADENLIIKTRWLPGGAGRADALATGGDLTGEAHASQCWNGSFISTYEAVSMNGGAATNGDPASCALQAAMIDASTAP
jgi:hypothetical protein